MDEPERAWEFAAAPTGTAPGVVSMVGYRTPAVAEPVHLGLPSATVTFIVGLDEGVRAAPDAPSLATARPAPVILGGLHLRASHVHQQAGQAGVQLALHPLAVRSLFGVPCADLGVDDYDGLALAGPRGRELHERLTDTAAWPEAFALIGAHLRERYRDRRPRPELVRAWRLLELSRGRARVGEVARGVDLSPRHLGTLFHREVGRSPKTVASLMRFDHARRRIAAHVHRDGRTDLAHVAAATGYTDQAHLTREFRRFTGLPPAAWAARELRNVQDTPPAGGGAWDHEHAEQHHRPAAPVGDPPGA
ncbi:AraC family transcriptional regulator [Nocardiopsis sp. CC223A]|uniref:helix-turn-helix domain-containing protein n=1 Tax=Nocardiopsis sp. CC223A TaxID=3044051 RepID=UPI00278C4920|nr:helix-turn-helix domain-containing protein [Nocardiopsis sp. CC223A]